MTKGLPFKAAPAFFCENFTVIFVLYCCYIVILLCLMCFITFIDVKSILW